MGAEEGAGSLFSGKVTGCGSSLDSGPEQFNTRNSEVTAGKREAECKGHLKRRRHVGPLPMPDGEVCTLTEAVSEW